MRGDVVAVDNRMAMKERIYAYDFAIVEMNLYLDTHPEDKDALCLFHQYQEKREQLIEAYEAQFGPYISNVNDVQGDKFTWICNPWPWEYSKEV